MTTRPFYFGGSQIFNHKNDRLSSGKFIINKKFMDKLYSYPITAFAYEPTPHIETKYNTNCVFDKKDTIRALDFWIDYFLYQNKIDYIMTGTVDDDFEQTVKHLIKVREAVHKGDAEAMYVPFDVNIGSGMETKILDTSTDKDEQFCYQLVRKKKYVDYTTQMKTFIGSGTDTTTSWPIADTATVYLDFINNFRPDETRWGNPITDSNIPAEISGYFSATDDSNEISGKISGGSHSGRTSGGTAHVPTISDNSYERIGLVNMTPNPLGLNAQDVVTEDVRLSSDGSKTVASGHILIQRNGKYYTARGGVIDTNMTESEMQSVEAARGIVLVRPHNTTNSISVRELTDTHMEFNTFTSNLRGGVGILPVLNGFQENIKRYLNTDSLLVGKKITKVTLQLKRLGSPLGTLITRYETNAIPEWRATPHEDVLIAEHLMYLDEVEIIDTDTEKKVSMTFKNKIMDGIQKVETRIRVIADMNVSGGFTILDPDKATPYRIVIMKTRFDSVLNTGYIDQQLVTGQFDIYATCTPNNNYFDNTTTVF